MADLDAIRERVNTEDTWAYGDSGEAHADARALLALLDEAVALLTGTDSPDWDDEVHAFLLRLGRDQ